MGYVLVTILILTSFGIGISLGKYLERAAWIGTSSPDSDPIVSGNKAYKAIQVEVTETAK